MRRHIKTLREKYKNLRRWQRITWIIVLGLIIAVLLLGNKNAELVENIMPVEKANKEVALRSVADLSLNKEPLSLIGNVQSESQVDIRTESSGSLTSVSVELGDTISKGQIIAQIENSTQRANVSQAQALVDAQLSQLQALKDSVTSTGNTVAVDNAYRTLLSSGLEAYPLDEEEDDDVTKPVVTGIYNGEEGQYGVEVYSSSATSGFSFRFNGLESGTTTVNEFTESRLGNLGLYLTFDNEDRYSNTDWVIPIPNTRSPLYVQNLNNYNSALDGQRGLQDQIRSQEAQVQSARSSLAAAQAQLEKTIVRTPIAGVVTVLSAELGDFVSNFQPVATVANENQLEVKTYITEDDKNSLAVGMPAMIAGDIEGEVASIAPAVDPSTKKIEVSIAVSSEADLINGQSVNVIIDRAEGEEVATNQIYIPLSALKVTAEGVVVFSVSDESVIEKNIVKEGPLVGDKVLITEGLTPDMYIVTDVRGISVGDTVTVIQ